MGSGGAAATRQPTKIPRLEAKVPSGPAEREAELARRCSRVMTLTGRGELAVLDAELESWSGPGHGPTPDARHWCVALWSAMRALMQGRFDACERLAREAGEAGSATGESDAQVHVTILSAHLRREQGRPAEAEVMLRELLARHPTMLAARVAWASLLGNLGRDSEARGELARLAAYRFAEVRADPGWLPAMCQLAELSALVERNTEGSVLYGELAPFGWRLAVEPMGAACHGSVSRSLGVLAHALGHWDEAAAHFEQALDDHAQAGAPVLAAHSRRQYAALLRARGRDADWERAIDLLSEAEEIYLRLGVDALASEAQSVLARSQDPVSAAPPGPNVWKRLDAASAAGSADWVLQFGSRSVTVGDSAGLRDLTCLVAQPGRSFHVADLLSGPAVGVGRAGTGAGRWARAAPQSGEYWARGGGLGVPMVSPPELSLDAQAAAECRARLDELNGELTRATRDGDPILAALARAERDFVAGALAEAPAGGDDPVARARRLVTLRIRRAIDRIGEVHPDLGRHLRNSVRTGTFCAYEPADTISWTT